MKFLKGLALSLLGLLLFLSLSIFGIVFTLENTLLNPDFVASEVDRIEISSLIRELTEEQISQQLPPEMSFLKEAIYEVIHDQEPWLKEQVRAAIYSGYDYFLGKSERLRLVISLEPLKENLRDSLRQAFLQYLPPPLSSLPQAQIEPYFNQYYQQIAGQIPSSFEVDESAIPPEVMAQLVTARRVISYAQTGYYALIGFMALLVLGLVLIHHQVRSATRGLGITFLTYGAIEYVSIFLGRQFTPQLPLQEIPSALQVWLPQFINDFSAPLEMFSIGCLVGGIVLIIVSFVYKRGVEAEE